MLKISKMISILRNSVYFFDLLAYYSEQSNMNFEIKKEKSLDKIIFSFS